MSTPSYGREDALKRVAHLLTWSSQEDALFLVEQLDFQTREVLYRALVELHLDGDAALAAEP